MHALALVALFLFAPSTRTLTPASAHDSKVIEGLVTAGEYRSYDGRNNNHLGLGATGTPLGRVDSGRPPYGYNTGGTALPDWVGAGTASELRSARDLSSLVAAQPADSMVSRRCTGQGCINSLFTMFGQMVVLDMVKTGSNETDLLPIPVPRGDFAFDSAATGNKTIPFKRSNYVLDSKTHSRSALNSNTHFFDGESIYGFNDEYSRAVRDAGNGGRLKTSSWGGPPTMSQASVGMANPQSCPRKVINTSHLYLGGNVRLNLIPQYPSLTTAFVREHNARAAKLQAAHPTWSDDDVFEMSRRWVIAVLQNIFYQEYLPLLLGESIAPWRAYDANLDPSVDVVAAVVGMRYGHSEVPSRYGAGAPVTRDSYFKPHGWVYSNESMVSIFRAMMESKQEAIDPFIVDDIRHYPLTCDGLPTFDLAAANIQRGRDNGVTSYGATRAAYGLTVPSGVEGITRDASLQERLRQAYGPSASVMNMDPWLTALAEDPVGFSMVGPDDGGHPEETVYSHEGCRSLLL